jgi:ABC-2 type transport system ATP-binding protein
MSAVIEVQHLHKRYGDTVAVDDISCTVHEGEIFGILGPNGAGKTTTVECIEGLRTPDRGSVSVLGLDPDRDRAELTQRLGVQLQDSQLPGKLRVDEALDLYSSFYRHPADWRALIDVLGLAAKTKTQFAKLSGGQQQRLSIARCLAVEPEVILMDEPCSALDPIATLKIEDLIHRLAKSYTIVIVTHNMQQAARVADYTAFMLMNSEDRCGELVEFGPTVELFNRPRDRRTEDYITGRFG